MNVRDLGHTVSAVIVPALPGVTELYAFRGQRALLDCFVYSLDSLMGKGHETIRQPSYRFWTVFSGVGAGYLTGMLSLQFLDITVQLAYMGCFEDACYAGAFCIAGRGLVGTGSKTLEAYARKTIG
jgi:hypothetical protein